MTLNLPEGTTIRGVTFGLPRVGNNAWATFFDSQVSNFTRVNNKRDPVPVIPGRLFSASGTSLQKSIFSLMERRLFVLASSPTLFRTFHGMLIYFCYRPR